MEYVGNNLKYYMWTDKLFKTCHILPFHSISKLRGVLGLTDLI